jgi:hypothetical protein
VAFKTFGVGDVLTASEVNTYLMRQAVITCTSGTRPSSPPEGMHIYETDTDKKLTYNGSSWVEMGRVGAWTAFTPSWTGATTNPTLGNGTMSCAYMIMGRTAFVRIKIVWGSTTNSGSGLYGLSLPAAATPVDTQALAGFISNQAGSARHTIAGFLTPGSGVFRITLDNGSSGVSSSAPFAWGTGDQLVLTGAYEIS